MSDDSQLVAAAKMSVPEGYNGVKKNYLAEAHLTKYGMASAVDNDPLFAGSDIKSYTKWLEKRAENPEVPEDVKELESKMEAYRRGQDVAWCKAMQMIRRNMIHYEDAAQTSQEEVDE